MNKKLFLQLVVISLAVSFILEAVIMTSIRTLNESGEGPIQNPALKFLARVMERGKDYQDTLRTFETMRTRLGLRPLPVWIIGADGRILAETPPSVPLPIQWRTLSKPRKIHGIVAHYPSFHLTPDSLIIRLDSRSPTFLLVKIHSSGAFRRGLLAKTVFLFSSMAASALAGLLITFVYLRQKSREAKNILGKLEKGDLKARFPLSRLDEAGSLMNDFNRMAEAIERLVTRIGEQDRTRQELLQELGHDLRTPMTSLKAAADTLNIHDEEMSREERRRFVQIILTESRYFLRMIDDLFFISEMEDPKYRKTAEEVDLRLLLDAELRNGEERGSNDLKPVFCELEIVAPSLKVTGNPILLKRLFRNALQNARRYATSRVSVTGERIEKADGHALVRIRIMDNGPGIAPDEAALFGKRRSRKFSSRPDLANPEISLGLGSVIMNAIVRVHGGRMEIRNLKEDGTGQWGTCLLIDLPV